MATRLAGESALYLVVNAAMKDSDFAYIGERLKGVADLTPAPDARCWRCKVRRRTRCWSVIRRASPSSPSCSAARATLRARPPSSAAPAIPAKTVSRFRWKAKTPNASRARCWAKPEVLPIGLGARDSLRLEAGLCLYGHDIDETTDPVEANLVWAIGKRRKLERGFAGADRVMERLRNGATRKRVGIRPDGRAPAREGTEIAVERPGHRQDHQRRLRAQPERPAGHGLCRKRICRRRHRSWSCWCAGNALAGRVVPMPFVPHRYKRESR